MFILLFLVGIDSFGVILMKCRQSTSQFRLLIALVSNFSFQQLSVGLIQIGVFPIVRKFLRNLSLAFITSALNDALTQIDFYSVQFLPIRKLSD